MCHEQALASDPLSPWQLPRAAPAVLPASLGLCPGSPLPPCSWGARDEPSLQLPQHLQQENFGARGVTFWREGWEAPTLFPPRPPTQQPGEMSKEGHWHPQTLSSCLGEEAPEASGKEETKQDPRASLGGIPTLVLLSHPASLHPCSPDPPLCPLQGSRMRWGCAPEQSPSHSCPRMLLSLDQVQTPQTAGTGITIKSSLSKSPFPRSNPNSQAHSSSPTVLSCLRTALSLQPSPFHDQPSALSSSQITPLSPEAFGELASPTIFPLPPILPCFTGSQHLGTPPALVQEALAPLQRLVYPGAGYSQALHGRWAPTKALQRQRPSAESTDLCLGVQTCSLPKGARQQVTAPTPAEEEEQGKTLQAAGAQLAEAGMQPMGSAGIEWCWNGRWGWHGPVCLICDARAWQSHQQGLCSAEGI